MSAALVICLPLLLAVVLAASGVGKLRMPDSLDGWRDLGVPGPLRRHVLLRAHPWAEIVLAAAVAALGGVPGVVATGLATALMAGYTALIVHALRANDGASCACFGARVPITRVMAARNIWLTLLSVAACFAVGMAPDAGGSLRMAWRRPELLVAVAIAAVTVALIASRAATRDAHTGTQPETEPLDYLRQRTPAVPVTQADGQVVNLRHLAARKPILLLAVSPTCGACRPIIASLQRYAELLPEVDVRLLLTDSPESSPLTQRAEPQSLHDVPRYVSGSIADWPTPTAVLLGGDGMLAGGPESGTRGIEDFVEDIYESLHGVRPSAAANADTVDAG